MEANNYEGLANMLLRHMSRIFVTRNTSFILSRTQHAEHFLSRAAGSLTGLCQLLPTMPATSPAALLPRSS